MISLLTRMIGVRVAALCRSGLFLFSAFVCVAGEPAQRISLFNGRDLTGWEGAPGWWSVEDGALTSESTPDKPCKKANYLVWTGARFDDFQLDCEFRISDQANSGIQIRSEQRPAHDMFGYQADMTGDGKLIGYIYHHRHGLVAERGAQVVLPDGGKREVRPMGDAAELLKAYKPGEWNHYRVVCKGAAITLFLNGVKMCDIVDHSVSAESRQGFIGLQMHPGPPMKVQFKNIELIPFASAVNQQPTHPEKEQP